MPYHVSKAHFSHLVEQALSDVPSPFAEFLEEVPVEVVDRSTPDFRKRVGLPPGGLLLGLYRGRPLTSRSVHQSGTLPDLIYIFQYDIERVSNTEAELVRQVRTTVLHEIGHLFGMSEKDLEELGYA